MLLFVAGILSLVLHAAAGDLASKYPYNATLFYDDKTGRSYVLHWRVNEKDKTIHFATNATTTGWVGLGISPDGRMPNSDVVIGWVTNSGQRFFKVASTKNESVEWKENVVDPQSHVYHSSMDFRSCVHTFDLFLI